MKERHENEQYFFDAASAEHLTKFVSQFSNPCCLCCPSLGQRLAADGVDVAILDIDTRFVDEAFDITDPKWIGQRFDLIICDPPFFNISLSQLFIAIRSLSHFDFEQPILISYLTRRSDAVVSKFAPFNLMPTGYHPKYETVRDIEKNDIQFFGNLSEEMMERLVGE